MTNRPAVPSSAEHALRVHLWYGTGALLAATIAMGIVTITYHWPTVPFNFGVLLTLLLGIPATSETLRAKRQRNDNVILNELEEQFYAG